MYSLIHWDLQVLYCYYSDSKPADQFNILSEMAGLTPLSLLLLLTFCLLSRTTPRICHIRFHFCPVLISRRLNNE